MTEHAELIEKVARAIHIASDEPRSWEELVARPNQAWADSVREIARAAIAAMPTAGDGWPSISPELIDKLNKLATYLTEQGEYEACDLIDTVVERLPPKAKG